MPLFRTAGTTIAYSVRGSGSIPVLCLAPGGMNSRAANWKNQPYDPTSQLSDRFTVVAMDQRNAGNSRGPLGSGWDSMRDDQLALLDHLGIKECLLVGSCIGPSFQLALMKHSPERFPAAVMMQPIGLARWTTEPDAWTGLNSHASAHWFGGWASAMAASGRFEDRSLAQLYQAMFEEPDGRDFVFSVTRADVQQLTAHSLLIYMGSDVYHPSDTSRELAKLAPNAALVERWKDEHYSARAVDLRIEDFLASHAGACHSHS